ncbi:MAG: OPT/YSL family transporter [Candidatus Korarchaeum sp.]|nr:OPT/YSL family transporter [Candidatus Korarchaeum sp.]
MEEEAREPSFTLRAVILSISFGLLVLFGQVVIRGAGGYSWTGEAALVIIVVSYAISSLSRKPLSLGEIGVIFGSVEVITVLFIGWQYIIPSWAIAALAKDFPLKQILPSFLVPKDEGALRSLLLGGNLDWGAWALPLVYVMLFAVLLSLFSYFNVIPLRRFYIEKERLVFPVATVAASFSRIVRDRGRELKFLWLGILSGFMISLLQRGHLLETMWEEFPAADLRFDLTPYLQSSFPGGAFGMDSGTQITPDLIAWSFLIPLGVQISIWVTAIVAYLLIPPVLVRMGLLPYEVGHDFSFYVSNSALSGPLPWYHLSTGLYVAVGLIPILLGSRYIVRNFKEWKDEPLARKWVFSGWTLTFVGSLLLLSVLGMSPAIALAILVLQLVYWQGYVWTLGMSNWIIPINLGVRGILDSVFFSSGAFSRTSSDAFFSGAANAMITDSVSAQPTASAEGFKFTSDTGMRVRTMFRAQVFGMLFGVIIGGLLLLVSFHLWGAAKKPLEMVETTYPEEGLLTVMGQLMGWKLDYFLEGFFVGVLAFLIRGIFPVFGISAIGMLLGLLLPQYAALYMMTSFLRYLVERYGSKEFMHTKALPFVAGFAVGGVLNAIGTSIVLIVKSSPLSPASGVIGLLIILAVVLPVVRSYATSGRVSDELDIHTPRD